MLNAISHIHLSVWLYLMGEELVKMDLHDMYGKLKVVLFIFYILHAFVVVTLTAKSYRKTKVSEAGRRRLGASDSSRQEQGCSAHPSAASYRESSQKAKGRVLIFFISIKLLQHLEIRTHFLE